jgi:hypothetical protein
LRKYPHPELDDATVDGLMKYFQIKSYPMLLKFLEPLMTLELAGNRVDALLEARGTGEHLVKFKQGP